MLNYANLAWSAEAFFGFLIGDVFHGHTGHCTYLANSIAAISTNWCPKRVFPGTLQQIRTCGGAVNTRAGEPRKGAGQRIFCCPSEVEFEGFLKSASFRSEKWSVPTTAAGTSSFASTDAKSLNCELFGQTASSTDTGTLLPSWIAASYRKLHLGFMAPQWTAMIRTEQC